MQKRKMLLLGSSHGKENGLMLLAHLGTQYEITSTFKPNAPLANVAEALRKLGNDFTKRDHITVLQWEGMLHLTLPGYILGSSSCHQKSQTRSL
jgi:hypothetical protein